MVKNRGGMEIPKMRVRIDFNQGIMREDDDQSNEDEESVA